MQPAVSIPKEKDRQEEGLAARGLYPKKEKDRKEGGLAARCFNLREDSPLFLSKKKKIDKKEELQPVVSISEKKGGLQPAGSKKKQTRRKACSPLFQSQKKKVDKKECEQPAVSIAKEKRQGGGLAARCFNSREDRGLAARCFNRKRKK